MKLAADKLQSVSGDEIQGKIGQFADVETILAFRDLMHKLNSDNLDVRDNAAYFNADFRSQYLMNSRVTGIDETDLLVLVGCNPKLENPVLNARIKKAVAVNGLEVVVIGSAPQLPYNYLHLGNSVETLKSLAEGTHPFSQRLQEADLPMVLTSSYALERSDAPAMMNYINKLQESTNLVNKEDQWNGFNVLHSDVGRINALELGITSKKTADASPAKVVVLLGADNFRHEEIPEDAFVIYQGHTGDEGAYYADLILPTSSYLEKAGTFVNTDGRPQQTRAALSSPGFSQHDWMVLRALSEELGTPLPYDTIEELRTRLAELAPHLIKYDVIEAPQLPYNYLHLGNSVETLKSLAEGTHPFSQRLQEADLPMVLTSSYALERSDAPAMMNYINKLQESTNLVNKEDQWNGFNVLHSDVGRINALELGITSKKTADASPAKVVVLLGADNFRHEEIPEDAFVIYQGHTGDEGAYYADLILPTSSYLEKAGTFVNTDGRPQQTRAALSSPGFSQHDWMVLRALSEELGTPLPYDTIEELRTRLAELAPHLIKYDVIEGSGFEELAHKPNGDTNLNGTALIENVDNFYMTDAISRNSHIMARCSRELNPLKQFNFKKDQQTWLTH